MQADLGNDRMLASDSLCKSISMLEPETRGLRLTITLWTLPKIGVLYVAKVGCLTPPRSIGVDQTLQPYLGVERIPLFYFARILCTFPTVCPIFSYSNVDQVAGSKIIRPCLDIPLGNGRVIGRV